MSPSDAAKLLDVPADATPDQLEARFNELRRKLEDKIAKAPTPGLKAKYRESLDQVTAAFETLTLAADSSSLPVTQKFADPASPRAGSSPGGSSLVGGPGSNDSGLRSQVSGLPPAKRAKSGGKEFLIVALVAVLLLGGGGWFVMKTRAENAERARLAAAAQAEKERVEAASRHAQAVEKEKLAAAVLAEQKRLEELAAKTRVGFAEARLAWQQAERAERDAKQELEELKSAGRSRDLTPGRRWENQVRQEKQAAYYRWLTEYLASHPARRAAVRTEELINARQIETAADALKEYEAALSGLKQEIDRRKPDEHDFFGSVSIATQPAGVSWALSDAFGNTVTGVTPAEVPSVGIGPATLILERPGWETKTLPLSVEAGKTARANFRYLSGNLAVSSNPSGAEVWLRGKLAGRTPLHLSELPPGEHAVELRLAEYKTASQTAVVRQDETAQVKLQLVPLVDREAERRAQELRDRQAREIEQMRQAREMEERRRSSGF